MNQLDKYMRTKCLVERRSKGKLFEVTNILNNTRYTQRIVDVQVANANFEDGLPTSLTREISYLNTLKPHDNINRLIEVEIFKNNTVSLIFEH